MSVNGDAGNSGRFFVGNGSPGNDVLITSGTFTNNSTGNFQVLGAADVANVNALSNAGSVFVNNGSRLNLTGVGPSNNSGTITLGGGTFSSPSTGATFTNTGMVQTQSSPSTMAFGGRFNNATGGTLNLNVSGDKAQISALTNGGTVNVATGALLGVGSGSFTAPSGYQQLSNGTLNEFIGGATSSFGVITVNGNASLAGLLGITLASGFDPTGDTFDFFNFTGSRTGTFSNGTSFQADGFNWTLTYNANNILLTAGSLVPNLVAATWSNGGGNWTDQTRWTCNPSFSPCMPTNANGTAFTANIDSPGNTLTLDGNSTPTSITINSLALTAGTLNIGSGATLNLVSQPDGITDIAAGAGLDVAGKFVVNGSTNALAKLANVAGSLTLDGQTTNIVNTLTVASRGVVSIVNATNLSVNGNLSNSGEFLLGIGGAAGNNVLTVNGTLTNNANGTFDLLSRGDTANVSALSNAGAITINPGTTLNITGGGPGITDVVAGSSLNVAGTFELGGNSTMSGLAQLANVGGSLTLDGQTLNDTPGGGAFTVTLGGSLSIVNGSNMSINGTLINGGTISLSGTGSTLSADLTNTGSIALNGNGDTLTDSGDFNNNSGGSLALNADLNKVSVNGNFNNNAGASVSMNGTNGTINVNGAFNNSGGVLVSTTNNLTTGAFSNSGNVTVGNGGVGSTGKLNASGGYTQSAGGTTIHLGGTITTPTFVVNGGTVDGGGTIAGNVQNNAGAITPAEFGAPSTLKVSGNYTQGTNGTLIIDLSGTGLGQFSVLSIGGNAALDGMVEFTAIGFTPGANESFTFLIASLVSGTFNNDLHPVFTNFVCPTGSTCTDVYAANSVTLNISASSTNPTPEPGSLLLLGSGLLGLAGVLRRKATSNR
jgi:hypothetical protein